MAPKDILLFELEGLNTYNPDIKLNLLFYFNKFDSFFYFIVYDFIYDNLAIELNVIRAAHEFKVQKLLFLGSSCIYPKMAPQPMKEEYLLTGPLETSNQ